MKKIIDKLKNKLFIMDSLFLCGFLIIAVTNFIINKYFGLYFIGIALILYSLFLYKFGGDKD